MIGSRVAGSMYRKGLRSLEAGDVVGLLRRFHDDCTLTFVGDTALGADGLRGTDVRRWFERFVRLVPDPRFEIQRLMVVGPPWRQRLAAHVVIRSTVDGEPYENQFAHFLVIRWARVIEDLVLEDTQTWERACHRLVAAGVAEAGDPFRPVEPIE